LQEFSKTSAEFIVKLDHLRIYSEDILVLNEASNAIEVRERGLTCGPSRGRSTFW
jgi:hypothetical protein